MSIFGCPKGFLNADDTDLCGFL